MRINSRSGFTVIEVVLFLAVTGLMMAGILASVGNGLHGQNYREGVNELRNKIQGQYDKVYSLTNNRSESLDPCTASGSPERGTSNCLYVGRMIHFNAPSGGSGSSLTIYPVVAELKPGLGGTSTGNRFDGNLSTVADTYTYEIDNYRISVWTGEPSLTEEYSFAWGLTGYEPSPSGPGFSPVSLDIVDSLLILRSPADGSVRSYKIPDRSQIYNHATPRDLASDVFNGTTALTNPQVNDELVVCLVDEDRIGNFSTPMAVKIAGAATGPGDIETISNTLLAERGMPQC